MQKKGLPESDDRKSILISPMQVNTMEDEIETPNGGDIE
jgi:hypothetical protein